LRSHHSTFTTGDNHEPVHPHSDPRPVRLLRLSIPEITALFIVPSKLSICINKETTMNQFIRILIRALSACSV